MVDFGGWELPQQYTSIREEHIAVRTVAVLFDISHMGRFKVTGEARLAFLQSLLTNDLSRIGRGRAQYNLMCNNQGGILDDLVVYWGDDAFTVVVNAANRERDLEWMRSHAPSSRSARSNQSAADGLERSYWMTDAVASAPTPMPEAEAAPVVPVEEPTVPMLATPSEPMATAVPLEDLPPVEMPIDPAPAEP